MTWFFSTTPTLFSVTLTSSKYFPFYSLVLADFPILSAFSLKIFLFALIGAGSGFVSSSPSCTERGHRTCLGFQGHQWNTLVIGSLFLHQQCCSRFVFPFLHLSFSPTMRRYEIMSEKPLVPFRERCCLHLFVSPSAGQSQPLATPNIDLTSSDSKLKYQQRMMAKSIV